MVDFYLIWESIYVYKFPALIGMTAILLPVIIGISNFLMLIGSAVILGAITACYFGSKAYEAYEQSHWKTCFELVVSTSDLVSKATEHLNFRKFNLRRVFQLMLGWPHYQPIIPTSSRYCFEIPSQFLAHEKSKYQIRMLRFDSKRKQN